MKHIPAIELILYVNDQNASADFYTKLFRQNPDLNVPEMTAFRLSENCKLVNAVQQWNHKNTFK